MKNVRQFSDKQLYQLCIGRASPQLSLFKPNSNTHRQVQIICNFLFFSVICSRWEHNLLCVLTAYVHHALVFCSKVRQKNQSIPPCCCCCPCFVSCIFAEEWEVVGKVQNRGLQRLGSAVSWPTLSASILDSWPWEFHFLLWQTGSRIPGSLTSFWQWLLMLWPASQDAVCEGGGAAGKRRIKVDRGYNLEMRESEASLPEEDRGKVVLESSFTQDLEGRIRSWETWLPFPTQPLMCCVASHNFTALR